MAYGDAPERAASLPCVAWHGALKNPSFVQGAKPDEVLLVDDQERVLPPDQRAQWIPIAE